MFHLTCQAMLHEIPDIYKIQNIGNKPNYTASISHHGKFAFYLFFLRLSINSPCSEKSKNNIRFVYVFPPYPIMKCANEERIQNTKHITGPKELLFTTRKFLFDFFFFGILSIDTERERVSKSQSERKREREKRSGKI